tara:strand:- start:64 stop:606 length:543 start_codon:yes stop_codon:yes gene_type:complete
MFWTNPTTIEPLRQHRWLLSNGVVWVWAKSVKPPSHTIETQKYQIGNHRINYPGLLEWQDVTVTIVDLTTPLDVQGTETPNSQALYDSLRDSGYDPNGVGDGISKQRLAAGVKHIFHATAGAELKISQIDHTGKQIQQWKLFNALIKDVTVGQLDYSSDELITIDLTIAYDHAELTYQDE